MQELLQYQNNLLSQVNHNWYRYLYKQLETDVKLLGIKGIRGVGKTTLMLQFLDHQLKRGVKGLYITAEHPYFYQNNLFQLASLWYSYGGKLLVIDEIHKYALWSKELKLIYDGFPELKVVFTSSSALDLYRGEADLSRRLVTQTLHGMSLREYLSLLHNIHIDPISLQDLLVNHTEITKDLVHDIKVPILPLFQDYLKHGYFPFINAFKIEMVPQLIFQMINTVLESDLSFIEDFSASHVTKIKKLLGVVAESVPFEPNISTIAKKLQLGRQTVNTFFKHLHDAQILNLIYEKSKGISQLQKPNKIYFENPNFVYALQPSPSIGTIRETFFMNQIKNTKQDIALGKKGDFLINGKYTFEIGGKNKKFTQIKEVENSWLAVDDIEIGFERKIPLWVFGFLY
ncbi:MAG: AAA family ATPase [Cyclobacteriaceae bacterium]|nr:AAA family ATPase [Cyclobacteriaceae bacterium]